MKRKWRIVTDRFSGYEVQWRWWWLPIWWQHGFSNTHPTIEGAHEYIKRHSNPVVWTMKEWV